MKPCLPALLLSLCLVAGSGFADDTAPVGSQQNPIKVYGVEMERFYCKFLRTPGGEEIVYERVGSVGKGPYGNILDVYKVKTKDGKKQWDVHIDMYHEDARSLPQVAPPGLLTLQQYTASKLKGKQKQYINLSLPSGSQFCPIAALYKDTLCVARITPNAGGRDISVLQQDGNAWLPLGSNGDTVTGNQKGYAFLDDMRVSPEGILWVSSVYTFPHRTYIYRYSDGKWELADPPDGDRRESEVIWDSGLHFLGDAIPCRMIETREAGVCVLRLSGGKWELAPVTDSVRKIIGQSRVSSEHIVKRSHDTWVVWKAERGDQSILRAAHLASPQTDGLNGPFDLMEFDSKLCVQATAVSPRGIIAVNLTDGNWSDGQVSLFTPDGADGFSRSECPSTGANSQFLDMAWSTNNTLFAVRNRWGTWLTERDPDNNGFELLGYSGGKWKTHTRHLQPTSEGNVGSARIFFHASGEPCVVWNDWF
jgi:hypothetical protein